MPNSYMNTRYQAERVTIMTKYKYNLCQLHKGKRQKNISYIKLTCLHTYLGEFAGRITKYQLGRHREHTSNDKVT